MKTLPLILALLASTTVTSVFAEGGADRLHERSAQLAAHREQSQQALAKAKAEQDNRQADAQRQADKPAS
ncbi:hypothetical protein ACNFIC_03115 [Pseudomonas sp. NY15463]|jgi:hypothetical protein|uniref:hypothetical protein n=1 Tax=Pseudomonas sp. NY15463 TaxID=3400361 RepID=UPI003A8A7560